MGGDEAKKKADSAPLYNNQHVFNYDWGTVTAAWLEKFPDPSLEQVKSVETVGHVVCQDTQTMHVRRLFNCGFNVPKLARPLLGEKVQVICVEEAHWDLAKRRLTVYGWNETGRNIIGIDEVCCYTEVGPQQTLYTQSATVIYRRGLLSGFLMPVAKEIVAGICHLNAHKGFAAMGARIEALRADREMGNSGAQTRIVPSRPLRARHELHVDASAGSSVNTAPLLFAGLAAATGYYAMNLLRHRLSREP